jgi:hypothetical protein
MKTNLHIAQANATFVAVGMTVSYSMRRGSSSETANYERSGTENSAGSNGWRVASNESTNSITTHYAI